MLGLFPTTLLPIVLASLRVVGTATCPTPLQVNTALTTSFGPRADEGPEDLAVIEQVKEGVRVWLLDEQAEFKQLLPEGSCSSLAQAAAVLLVSWRETLATPPLPALPGLATTSQLPPDQRRENRWLLTFGGALGYGDNSGGGFLALLAEGSLEGTHSRWGAQATLRWQAAESEPLGFGLARFQRLSLGLGPSLRLTSTGSPLTVRVQALVLPTLLTASGSAFELDPSTAQPDLGLALGLRVQPSCCRFLPWLELSGEAWPIPYTLAVAGTGFQLTAPRWQALALLGFDFEAGLL